LLVWAEEKQLNPNELQKKLSLAKDKCGYTAWCRAAVGGRLSTLDIMELG